MLMVNDGWIGYTNDSGNTDILLIGFFKSKSILILIY